MVASRVAVGTTSSPVMDTRAAAAVASVVTVAVITVEDMAAAISSNSSSPTVEMVVTAVTVVTAATMAAVMVSFDLVAAVLTMLGAGRPIEGFRTSDESKH